MNNEWEKSQVIINSSQAVKIRILGVSFNSQFLHKSWLIKQRFDLNLFFNKMQ